MNKIRLENFTRFVETSKFRFLEAMDDLVRVRDANGEILFENKAMRALVEKTLISNRREWKSSEIFFELYSKSNEIKETIISELNIEDKVYNVKASPIFDNDNSVNGYIEVFRDITNERNTNKELVEAKEKMEKDILLAKNIQRSILPKRNRFNNISFQFAHLPSEDLSGDVFDVVDIDRNKTGIYIADVVGHGISASIMTMFIRQSMRRILQENEDFGPEDTILELKRMYSQLDLDISQYFSIIYFLIDTKQGKIKYVNAGHNTFPIIFSDDKVEFLENKGKVISNLFSDVRYEEKEFDLIANEKFLLYTDGLAETSNMAGENFDDEKLIEWVRNNKNERNLVSKLVLDLAEFRHEEQKDDIAILYFEVRS